MTPNGLIGQALDAGINFIDTADVYAGGVSEQITGQALKNLKVSRESVVVATKVFGETGPGANMRGASRSHIMDGVKASLKRLQANCLNQRHGSAHQARFGISSLLIDCVAAQANIETGGAK